MCVCVCACVHVCVSMCVCVGVVWSDISVYPYFGKQSYEDRKSYVDTCQSNTISRVT